jgi:fused signal recognition particle receptor
MHLFDRAAVGDEVWSELEELLISADVGINTAGKIIGVVREKAEKERLDGAMVRDALKAEMTDILSIAAQGETSSPAQPRISLFVGVNGGGKTTSIAKYAHRLQKEGKSVLLVAADTFRAAAIDQLKKWGERTEVEVIAYQPGADPGAVVYDAIQAARHRQVEEIIIDTAGRLHTKYNLMEELKKIKRVAAKADDTALHEVILVIDATTGQNGLTQARYFTDAVGVTGIFLAKLDGTARGGIVLAICDELQIPIKYVGVGEKLEDMADFDAETFVEALCA